MLNAAIYARKSTDNEAGVARQIEIARDFATKQGWTVDDPHVFSDNDASGATHDRPGLNARQGWCFALLACHGQAAALIAVLRRSESPLTFRRWALWMSQALPHSGVSHRRIAR
jgi:hypothetical protein